MNSNTKKCPKCGKEILSHWKWHECGWRETEKVCDIDELIRTSEQIGTISSPSSTSNLSIDILGNASSNKLLGELALFKFIQNNKPTYALGQITEVRLKNVWLEKPTIRCLARDRGYVNPISEQQDVYLGEIVISAVLSNEGSKFEPTLLGTVPPTGTPVYICHDEILKKLLIPQLKDIFYLGYIYEAKPKKLPLWFKHFGQGEGGVGEAYHLGIFGKTGSGKSVLAKMIMTAYAKHPEMAILVIDPQGEFSKDATDKPISGGFILPLKTIFKFYSKEVYVISVKDLILDTWELFHEILFESPFFERLTIPKGDNRKIICDIIVEKLKKSNYSINKLHERNTFEFIWKLLGDKNIQTQFYRTSYSRERFNRVYLEADKNIFYSDYWKSITELFNSDRKESISIKRLIDSILNIQKNYRPIVIVNLSKETAKNIFWNDQIQALVIKRLLDSLITSAEECYKEGKFLNTLVVLDEAHRFAPREKLEDEKREDIKLTLVDAVRTTRKYGVGWMFISQTLSSLHRDIISQLRIFFIGYGLSLGLEFLALQDLMGRETNALKLYQSFRDPHSAFDESSREYSFMTIGPVSPLSFTGAPLFFTAFNSPKIFLKENNIVI